MVSIDNSHCVMVWCADKQKAYYMKTTKAERQESIKRLREIVEKSDRTVYTILRHVSRSGMSRLIDCYVIVNNRPQWISYHVAQACGYSLAEKNGDRCIRVGGCGMDMGFSIVYNLSSVLFPVYTCTGEGCRSNDHVNGDRDYTVGKKHSDGGYALHQEWI